MAGHIALGPVSDTHLCRWGGRCGLPCRSMSASWIGMSAVTLVHAPCRKFNVKDANHGLARTSFNSC